MSKNLAVTLASLLVLIVVSILKMDDLSISHILGYLLGAVSFVFAPGGVVYLLKKKFYPHAVVLFTLILIVVVISSLSEY